MIPRTVGDLGTIYDGPHATPTRRETGAYFLNIASLSNGRLDLSLSDHVDSEDFDRWTRRVQPQEDDLLFSYETRLGEAALLPGGVQACLGRRMALLRPNLRVVNPRFLLYYYLSPAYQQIIASRSIHGATVSRIPLNRMAAWPVSLPSMKEQDAAAEILGSLDEKIAANGALISSGGSLLARQFEEGLARNPPVRKLFLEVAEVRVGEPFNGAYFVGAGNGRPLIRIRDLKTNSCQVWTTESRAKEKLVEAGDLLVGMDAEFGPSAWTGDLGLLNQRVCKITSRFLSPAVLREAIRKPLTAIERATSGTTVIHLNKSDLSRSEILLPTPAVSVELESTMQPIYDHAITIAAESSVASELRDTLLPGLVPGRLRAKDVERQVEDVI